MVSKPSSARENEKIGPLVRRCPGRANACSSCDRGPGQSVGCSWWWQLAAIPDADGACATSRAAWHASRPVPRVGDPLSPAVQKRCFFLSAAASGRNQPSRACEYVNADTTPPTPFGINICRSLGAQPATQHACVADSCPVDVLGGLLVGQVPGTYLSTLLPAHTHQISPTFRDRVAVASDPSTRHTQHTSKTGSKHSHHQQLRHFCGCKGSPRAACLEELLLVLPPDCPSPPPPQSRRGCTAAV